MTATDCARDWGALRRVPSVLEAYMTYYGARSTENHPAAGVGGPSGGLGMVRPEGMGCSKIMKKTGKSSKKSKNYFF